MPWGKYQGIEMANVPANYLIYIYENGKCDEQVKAYIDENMEVLKLEVKNRIKK